MPEVKTILVSDAPLYDGLISPLIYGEFIEPLNDLLPGMWAEKVRDRSFEGVAQPAQVYPPGQNWVYPRWQTFTAAGGQFDHWPSQPSELEMLQAEATLTLDAEHPFVGKQSARVNVQSAGTSPFVAGISQAEIAVQAGQAMHLELYLRADAATARAGQVTVLLGRNYGVFFRPYAQVTLNGLSQDWQCFGGTLTSPVTDEHATLAIGISQPGTFWVDKVSLMPQDALRGWRPDVVQAICALKPGIIRFGGSSLIFYDWRTGVGPREKRAPFMNHPWENMEENDVGLHEFLEFCELVDAQPLICLNSNSATVEQILEEIEYCNGAADTRWGSVRAAMGHPQPFNVHYWQIGNEQSGDEYEQRMVDYAHAIRTRHPDLTLLTSYPSDNILRNLSDEVDYVCPHIYTPYGADVAQEMQSLIDKIRQQARNKKLKIAVTEWNHTGGHWGWARAWLLTQFNALNAARMFNLYQRHGDMVDIANRSNMTNSCNSGILQTRPLDMYVTPTYHLQRAYANFAGDCALQVNTSAGEELDIAATRRTTNGEIALFVVNYTGQAERREVSIKPDRFDKPVRLQVWTLAAPGLDAVNDFVEKERVAPREVELATNGEPFSYDFPPYSVTILRTDARQ
jgi:alpha-N-arabinofuranosidase